MINIVRIFLDLEATQFSKEIISIGAVSDKNQEFYKLVRSKKKITKLITDLTNITNEDLKKAKKFYEVFDEFWDWCCSQKTTKNEKIIFFVYGNFDGELIKAEYLRRPKDKRLFYIYSNIIDVQYYLMMSVFGSISYSLSLLKRKWISVQMACGLLRDRIYKCPSCGLEIDRDYNAAINLSRI